MSNENCLEGMVCPSCGSEGPFAIYAESWFLVYDDGIEEYEDIEWGPSSPCICQECGYDGVVRQFDPEREDIPGGTDDRDAMQAIYDVLYLDMDRERQFYNADKVWDEETIERVAEVVNRWRKPPKKIAKNFDDEEIDELMEDFDDAED